MTGMNYTEKLAACDTCWGLHPSADLKTNGVMMVKFREKMVIDRTKRSHTAKTGEVFTMTHGIIYQPCAGREYKVPLIEPIAESYTNELYADVAKRSTASTLVSDATLRNTSARPQTGNRI